MSSAHTRRTLRTFRRSRLIEALGGTFMIAALVGVGSAQAQSAWTGAGGNNNWATTGNWSTGVVPNAAGVQVQFIDADASLNGKTISLGTSTFLLGDLSMGAVDNTSLKSFTISGGTLNFNNSGSPSTVSLSGNRAVTINSAITTANALTISNASAYGTTLTVGGTVATGANALTLDAGAGATLAMNGAISGSGGVSKTGTGTLNLNAANTFSGTFNFNAGTIGVGNNAAFGTSTINLAAGGNQIFDVSSGSRTVGNQLLLNGAIAVNGTGNTLTFSATETQSLTGSTLITTGNVATLDFGANFALQGSGSITKQGFGALTLESKNNTFSGGLNITQGTVNTGAFTDTLVIGAATGTDHMLGTGNIILNDQSSVLNINATNSSATVQFAGGLVQATNGAKINVLNNAAVNFAGGQLDFGTGAQKGSLNLSGAVTLGNTQFLNAAGSTMSIGGNLTFSAGSTIGQSGIDIALSGSGAQTVSGTGGAVTGLNNFSKTGSGTATFQASLTGLSTGAGASVSVLGGTLDAGTTVIGTPTLNMGNGTLALHAANQVGNGTTTVNLLDSTSSVFNLNGFDQSYAGLSAGSTAAAGQVTFNLGGVSTVANTLSLGTVTGTPGAIRISGWDGTPATAFDHVLVNGTLSAAQLANVWFQGYGKGAVEVGGELRPMANLSTEWNGQGGDNLWGTAGNWVGGDAYSVPNHAGATAVFGNLAGDLGNKSINLSGGTWTVGNVQWNPSSSTVGAVFNLNNGTLVFDSGQAGVAAQFTETTNTAWAGFSPVTIRLNSDLVVSNLSQFYTGTITGTGGITKNGTGGFRVYANNSSYSGGFTLNQGGVTIWATPGATMFGTGPLTLNGGSLGVGGTVSGFVFTLNNPLVIGNSAALTVGNMDFAYNGNVTLNGTPSVFLSSGTPAGYAASTIFDTGLNLVGSGSLSFSGTGTGALQSANNTFSGGLSVGSTATVSSQLTSDAVLGALSPGNNYLGAGNITVTSGGSTGATIQLNSQGHATTLQGGVLQLANAGRLISTGGGAFTLAGGTLNGGTPTTKGVLQVSGDLTFGGSTLVNLPSITVDTSTNPTGSSTVYSTAGGTVGGIGNFNKQGAGVTTLDASITSFAPVSLNLNGGVLQLGADNQIAASTTVVLNGGALSANNHIENLSTLNLRASSSLLLGNTGGFTFTQPGTGGNWVAGSILTIQNGGQPWLADTSSTYVRFSSNPSLTGTQLGNIAFTGYEAGALVSSAGGFWYLLPSALPTTEWGGGGGSNTNWSTAANWLNNTVPNGAGVSATIRDADANLNGKTINVDANVTIGHLNVDSSAGQAFTIGGSGTLTIDGGAGTAQIKQDNVSLLTIAAPVVLNGSTALVMAVPPTQGYLNWSGNISGAGGLVKTGAGTLQISGGSGNSYAGGFLWQDASLIQINASGSLFGSGVWTIGNGTGQTYTVETTGTSHSVSNAYTLAGSLNLRKDTVNGNTITTPIGTTNTLTLSGPGTLAAGMQTVTVYSNNSAATNAATEKLSLVLNGTLSGSGGIFKNGYGDLYLNGVGNTFSGGVSFNQGRLYLGASQALGTGVFSISNTAAPYVTYLQTTAGSVAAPLQFSNPLNITGGTYFDGFLSFNYNGTSQIGAGIHYLGSSQSGSLLEFGANNILTGSGSFGMGLTGSSTLGGTVRFLGANTFSGGVSLLSMGGTAVVQVGSNSVVNGSGQVVSGALGTGTVSWQVGALAPYATDGTTTRTLSNTVLLGNAETVFTGGTATTLVLDTPTIALRNGKTDLSLTINTGATLRLASQLVDSGAPGGITKQGAGTLELTNGSNQIGDGIRVSAGTLLATATGNVTTGRLDAGHNYLGTGALILDGGQTTINTVDGATVLLSGSGMTMNNAANLTVSGGANIQTVFDGNSSFTGSATSGSLSTSGTLIKQGAGTTTSVGAKLVTPNLSIQSGTLALTQANLMAGVGKLTLAGGTLATGGLNQTMGSGAQLVLSNDSVIDFGNGASILTVGSMSLDPNHTLTLSNWSGNAGSGSGTDQFLVLNGVSSGQKFSNVSFGMNYAPGAKALLNAQSQIELVPLGVAYIWDNHAGTNVWAASNWTDVGSPGAPGDAAVFADNTPSLNGSTISTGLGVTVGSISVNSTQGQSFNLSGGALTFDSGDAALPAQLITAVGSNASPTISAPVTLRTNLLIAANGSGTITLAGAISGPNTSITKAGSGTLVLGANSANSNFTNGFTLAGGDLQVGASSSLNGVNGVASGPVGLGTLTLAGGSIEPTGGAQTLHNAVAIAADTEVRGPNALTLAGSAGASATIANPVTLNVSDAAGSLIFGANLPLTGSGALTKTGAGAIHFDSASAGYSGAINITQGLAGIGANTGFGTGAVSLAGGTTLAADANALSVGNAIALGTGVETVATGTNNLSLNGAITGTGTLTKTGSGTLTLGGNSSYTGGTALNAGAVTLTSATGAGTGAIGGAAGTNLNLAFNNASLSNPLSGAGTTTVSGTNITLAGNNSALSGPVNIAAGASANAANANNLGSGAVTIAANGTLNLDPAAGNNFTLTNPLSGAGTLAIQMGAAGDTFNFGAGAAGGYSGTAKIQSGTLALDSNASAALAGATLELDAGGKATPAGAQSIGKLNLAGGTLVAPLDPNTASPTSKITTGALTLGSGAVQMDLTSLSNGAALLRADDGVNSQLVAATTVSGNAANLSLVDASGNPLGANSVQAITQGGNIVAQGSYSQSLSSVASGASAGLYLSYQLNQLNLQAGQTLSLNAGTDSGSAAELKALVTGAGNLDLASGAGGALTISNGANSYTGATTVSAGTVKAGAANVMASSANVNIASGATLDLNGNANSLNNLTGAGNLIASAALTLNNTSASSYAGVISGSGGLTKTGSGSLTLSAADTYAGASTINTGSVTLANAQALSSGAVSIAAGASVNLDFSNAAYANATGGAGTVQITGQNITLSGTNTLSGQWALSGTASAASAANLGTAAIALNGAASQLSLNPTTGGFTLNNPLTGNGTLVAHMGDTASAFAFGAGTGSAFAGTLDLQQGTLGLTGANTNALTHANVVAEAGATITVGAGVQTIGGLKINGGQINFDATVPAQTVANGTLAAGTLDVSGAGTIQIQLPSAGVPNPPSAGNTNVLAQDDAGALTRLASSGAITGTAGALSLVDQNGNPISSGQSIAINEGGAQVATGTYDYRLSTQNAAGVADGLYVSYGLKTIDLLSGNTLTLTPDSGASGLAQDLSAQVTGSGNLAIAGGAAQGGIVSLSNTGNNYTGATTVETGTLRLGADGVLGQTSQLHVQGGASADLNGHSQTVGQLNTDAGSHVNFNGGTLTLSDAQRAGGVTDGGAIEAGTLAGGGSWVIDPSVVHVNGVQSGYTGAVTVTGGSELIMNNAGAFNNASGITLVGATDTATFASEQSYNSAWTDVPVGSASVAFSGAGLLQTQGAGVDLTLAGNNSAFTGQIAIGAGSTVRASVANNLGSAAIANAGTFDIDTATDWRLSNAVSGAGAFIKDGTGTLTIAQANSGMSGASTLNAGTLQLSDAQGVGSGAIAINTAAGNTATGLELSLASAATFANALSGAGSTRVDGAGATTIAGANGAYSGQWLISGTANLPSAAATSTANLGTGGVQIAAGGTLNATTAGAFSFNNALTGAGTLNASNAGGAFSFGAGAGSAFAGTLNLSNNSFDLSGNNTAALTGATLVLGSGNATTVGSGNQAIGGLAFAGGRAVFNATVPAQTQADGVIVANTLNLGGSGTVRVNIPSLSGGGSGFINPPTDGSVSLFAQDDGGAITQLARLAAGGTLTGSAANLQLQDQNGNAISAAQSVAITQGGTQVATGTYDYGLNTGAASDGLYVAYKLTQLDIAAGQSLQLVPDAGASGAGLDLAAQVTGAGGINVGAGTGVTVSLSNSANNYSGATQVSSGTLALGADNALGQTSGVSLASGTALNLAGHSQTIGDFSGAADSTLNLGGGALTVSNGGTSDGSLSGAGALNLTGGTLAINGANAGLSAAVSIAAGASASLNDLQGLGTGAIADNGALSLNSVAGDFANALAGAGSVNLVSAALSPTGDNSAFAGQWNVDAASVLNASAASQLGSAAIADAGLVRLVGYSDTLGNVLSGAGTVQLTSDAGGNGANVTLGADNSAFAGQWQIDAGSTLNASALNQLGSAALVDNGTVNLATHADTVLNNALSGSGVFSATPGAGHSFDFGAGAGTAFAGTFAMGAGNLSLAGTNTAALTLATLRADAGSAITVGDGEQAIGGLSFNGGTVHFKASAPDQMQADGIVRVQALDASGSGTVQVTVPNPYLVTPIVPNGSENLLRQDEIDSGVQLVAAGQITGNGNQLSLVDQNGTLISNATQVNIAQGGATVAVGTYDYGVGVNSAANGLYAGYHLTQLDLQAGQNLTLTEDAGASGAAADMAAKLTGAGNLVIAANTLVSLSNSANDYTGATTVASGTLQAQAANVISKSQSVSLQAGTTLDANGYDQTLNNLSGAAGSTLNLGQAQASVLNPSPAAVAVTVNNTQDTTFAGSVSGASGQLIKSGAGAIDFSGSVRLGQLTVNDGQISFGTDTVIDPLDAAVVMNGGTAIFNGGAIGAASGDAIVAAAGTSSVELHGTQVAAPGLLYNVLAGATGHLLADGAHLAGDLAVQDAASAQIDLRNASALQGRINGSGANVTLDATSQWQLTGNAAIGTLSNAGTIDVGGSAANGYRTLGVTSLVGQGGTVVLHTNLGADNSPTDKIALHGGSATGNTRLSIVNTGGIGAYSLANGIQVVDAQNGATTTADAFTLNGRVVGGAYEYLLQRGAKDGGSANSWYLRSDMPAPQPDPTPATRVLRPEVAAYQANQAMAQDMLGLLTLHDREGDAQVDAGAGNRGAGWATAQTSRTRLDSGNGQLTSSMNQSIVRFGGELGRAQQGEGRYAWGLMGAVGYGNGHSNSNITGYSASSRVDASAVGAYATWMQDASQRSGWYVDTWAQLGHTRNTVSGQNLASEHYSSNTSAASLELGYGFKLGQAGGLNWTVQPQAQVIISNQNTQDHREANGTLVSVQGGGMTTRLGARLFGQPLQVGGEAQGFTVQPYAEFNWWHNGQDNAIAFDGLTQASGVARNQAELKVGAQAELGAGWSAWGQLNWRQSFGQDSANPALATTATDNGAKSRVYGAQVGVRYRW